MREQDGRDAHEGAVARRPLPGLLPRDAVLVVGDERANRAANPEDAVRTEPVGQVPGHEAIVREELLERPEGHLRVVGRQPDAPAVRLPVRQVVADLAEDTRPPTGRHALARVPQRIADREAEQHSLDAIEVEGVRQRRRRAREVSVRRDADTAALAE